ncbi:MAG: pyridoxamine 5'-phosphate oxidase family protein [Chloroflexi bacterium]|nr:pyridoxamine 5'-phosphate oxidase family protein [Chloroflexota bacterium]
MSSREFIESCTEMESILRREVIGYLGLSMNGEMYVVPLNYGYVDGKILFHCALTGKKLDYIKANPHVCFTVGWQSGEVRRHAEGDPCHMDNDSVICYGKAWIVEDVKERKDVLDAFNRCFDPNAKEITLEAAENCYAVEIEIAEMTGRRERERKYTYWKHSFDR